MRTKLFLLVGALSCMAVAGCSLVYNGTHYQGGTATDTGLGGTDSGMPTDTGVDAALGDDGGAADGGPDAGSCHDVASCPVMGTWCDIVSMTCKPGCDDASDCTAPMTCNTSTHVCAAASCTSSATCTGDTFCDTSVSLCVACDGDGDHYYAAGAGLGCARLSHLNGGDCDDANPNVYPFARPDCTTAISESCPLPVMPMPMLPPPLVVTEVGLTPVHTLWTETGTLHVMGRDPIFMVAGDDSPQLPGGEVGGMIVFIANDASTRSVQAVPLTWDGVGVNAETLFGGFHVGGLDVHHVRGMSGSSGGDVLTMSVAGVMGTTQTAFSASLLGHPVAPVDPFDIFTVNNPIAGGAAGFPSVGLVETSGVVGAAVATQPPSPAAPIVESFGGPMPLETGGANYMPGSWMVGSGSSVMWAASTTDVAIWNGNDSAISPSTVGLGTFTSTTPPRQVNPLFRGAIDSRPNGSSESYVAAVPVGTTTMPPSGRIALLRWTAPIPSVGTRTDSVIPASVVVSELDLGPGARLNGYAGLALFIVDDASGFIVYQDGSNVVARPIPVPADASRPSPENPPSITLISLGVGETCTALDTAGGFYPDTSMMSGIGRFGVACMVEQGTMPHELRVRAIEACVAAP